MATKTQFKFLEIGEAYLRIIKKTSMAILHSNSPSGIDLLCSKFYWSISRGGLLENIDLFVTFDIYAPLRRRRGILRCTCRSVCRYVGRYVGMSVSLNLVQLITQERFAPEATNVVGR